MHGRFIGTAAPRGFPAVPYCATWSVVGCRSGVVLWSAELRGPDGRVAREVDGRFPLSEILHGDTLPASEVGRCAVAAAVRARVADAAAEFAAAAGWRAARTTA
jgi:hypothetical protein